MLPFTFKNLVGKDIQIVKAHNMESLALSPYFRLEKTTQCIFNRAFNAKCRQFVVELKVTIIDTLDNKATISNVFVTSYIPNHIRKQFFLSENIFFTYLFLSVQVAQRRSSFNFSMYLYFLIGLLRIQFGYTQLCWIYFSYYFSYI